MLKWRVNDSDTQLVVLTLDTYSHVLPDMQQQAAERIEKLLFKTGS